jgi:hypothetical protein
VRQPGDDDSAVHGPAATLGQDGPRQAPILHCPVLPDGLLPIIPVERHLDVPLDWSPAEFAPMESAPMEFATLRMDETDPATRAPGD